MYNNYKKDNLVYKELRAISHKYQVIIITATQNNRSNILCKDIIQSLNKVS